MEEPAFTSELATTASPLSSLVLEPSWLSKVYKGHFDCSDGKIAKILTLA